MESFIDLMSNTTYTPAQLEKRLTNIENQHYGHRSEQVINRIGTGKGMGSRPTSPVEDQVLADFSIFMEDARAMLVVAEAENTLLINTIGYEQSLARLDKYILLEGRPEQEYVPPTYDPETGEELTPEIPHILGIEPLPEYVDSVDEEGNPIQIRNPLVVQDEAERAEAQDVVDNATAEVTDLYELRNS